MPTRRKRSLEELERYGPLRASSKLPAQERPTYYVASGFQSAREAASMTQQQVADISGYPVGVIASIENNTPHHTLTISRAASAIVGHDLSAIRDEGG